MKLKAYASDKRLLEFQPLEIKNRPPDWWHKLKKMFTILDTKTGINIPTPTIRACPGVMEFVRKPIVIRSWTDAIFKIYPDGRASVSTPKHNGGEMHIGIHEQKQYGELYPNHAVVKVVNPWVMVGSDRTNFLCTDVHYEPELRKHGIFVAPGITNFYDQHVCNIFLVFPLKEESYQVSIKYDQPLMAVFPMTDDTVKIEMNKVSRDELNEISNAFPSTFLGRYYTRKHTRRK